MQAPDRPPLRLVEHALRLIGRTHKAGPDAARVAGDDLARWRALDRTHAEAEAVARTLWDASDGSALREAIAQPSGVAEARATRRRVVGMLGLGAVVTAVAGSARWYLAQPTASLALQAGHGQQLARTLPDGTAVDLGARSS
ncbi:MAG: iron dicitrate transport regulator FecR, partial [Comamonadaceae bacterium]